MMEWYIYAAAGAVGFAAGWWLDVLRCRVRDRRAAARAPIFTRHTEHTKITHALKDDSQIRDATRPEARTSKAGFQARRTKHR